PVSNMPSPPRAVFTQNCRYANEIGVDMPRSRRRGGVRAPFPAHCFDGGEPFQEFILCRNGRARFEIEAVGGKAARPPEELRSFRHGKSGEFRRLEIS